MTLSKKEDFNMPVVSRRLSLHERVEFELFEGKSSLVKFLNLFSVAKTHTHGLGIY